MSLMSVKENTRMCDSGFICFLLCCVCLYAILGGESDCTVIDGHLMLVWRFDSGIYRERERERWLSIGKGSRKMLATDLLLASQSIQFCGQEASILW